MHRRLIIDTLGAIDQHEEFEHLFEFYPDGLRGMLSDFLAVYLDKRPLEESEEDAAFFNKVLTLYEQSIQYRLNAENSFGNLGDIAVTLACYYVCDTARQMVELQEDDLRRSVIAPTSMSLGAGYMLVPLLA